VENKETIKDIIKHANVEARIQKEEHECKMHSNKAACKKQDSDEKELEAIDTRLGVHETVEM